MREPPSSVQATADAIRQRIAVGEINAGDPLPSMRKLAKILRTSFLTVRKAVALLAREGIVVVEPRKVARVVGLNLTVKKRSVLAVHLFNTPELPTTYSRLLDVMQPKLKAKRWKLAGRTMTLLDQRERRALVEELAPEVLIAMGLSHVPLIMELEATGRPVISVDVDHGYAGISSVSPNHYGEGILVTRKLIESGAKNIVCIRHNRLQFMDGRRMQTLPHWQRHLGYRFAMRDAGLQPLILSSHSPEALLPKYYKDADALFLTSYNDEKKLIDAGRVPEDIPVGTFGDIQTPNPPGPVWISIPDFEYFAKRVVDAVFAGHQARPFSTVPCTIEKIG